MNKAKIFGVLLIGIALILVIVGLVHFALNVNTNILIAYVMSGGICFFIGFYLVAGQRGY